MGRNVIIFILLLIVLVAVAFFVLRGGLGRNSKTADINGNIVKLEVADNDEKRAKGLSERDSLANDTGMLFLFDKPGMYSFWMKNMRFPIDILFLNNDEIVTIHPNVQPIVRQGDQDTANLMQYSSTKPANRVLELNAGKAQEYNLKEGDTIKFNL